MGKSSGPKPANPATTAAAQTSTNIGTAIAQQELGNITQVTPDGTLSYERTGNYQYTDPNNGQIHDIPNYTQTVTLSDAQQQIKNQHDAANLNLAQLGNSQSGRINDLLASPLDMSNLPERGDIAGIPAPQFQGIGDAGDITRTYGQNDFSADRQRVEDALMARMQPSLDQDRGRLESRLASQGIRVGSAAFDDAMRTQNQQVNDARFGAIMNAGQEQSRLTGIDAQRAAFENQAQQQSFGQQAAMAQQNNANQRDTLNADLALSQAQDGQRNAALNETFAARNQPINEITALLSGSQVSNPNFSTPARAQLQGTDFAGIQANSNQLAQQQANAQNAHTGSLLGGLMGLGGTALIVSDRRAKTDIKKVGKTDDGQKIYSYRYKAGGPKHIGLMAQEVQKKTPGAVVECNGLKMVNYEKALS